ncbi:MAG: extracellular solute-binding protein, partial [Paracoccaceae bacterium]
AGIDLNLAYVVPETGAPAWVDCLVVPADAPNAENAYKFLEFMLQPEVAAGCTNYTGYASANVPAQEFVDEAILNDPAVYPDEETKSRLWTPNAQTEEQDRAINRVWAEIKAG